MTQHLLGIPVRPVLELHEESRRIKSLPLSSCVNWQTELQGQGSEERWEGSLQARLSEGKVQAATLGLRLEFPNWSESVYVLLPGAVYAGNRFPAYATPYPPVLPAGLPADAPPLQSEVPRLRYEPGPSCIRQLTSDPAFPGIGLYFPESQTGHWILTPATNEFGLLGYELAENDNRTAATLTIFSPGMRREFEYAICCDRVPSTDRARDWSAGESVTLPLRIEKFPCHAPQELFERLVELRRALVPAPTIRHDIPFSEVWNILTEKYLRENWIESKGYFAIGVEPMRSQTPSQNWQMGWTGGMLSPAAFVRQGDEHLVARSLRNFDFVFPKGQAPSGYFYADGDGEIFLPDNFKDMPEECRTLVRKSGDGLFYMLTMLEILEQRGQGNRIKAEWTEGLRRCADAFVATWDREGQWGHFVNHDTGAVVVPGTASGGIVPAALALASRRFPDRAAEYRRVAESAAGYYDDHFLRRGFTNGGPGDAAQCPDSESLAGLLESYVTLFEETREIRWLETARRAATHVASWTVSYDFPFPPESTFGKLGMLANGTVLANAQNKHSAPGICTHSGLSLLRLFRHLGESWILDLLRDIAHTLPQYMSRADRPIPWTMPYNQPTDPAQTTLHPGWMCERVNLTYWGGAEKPGEIFYYSCWSEISLLLTIADLPGIYARPESHEVWSLDHLAARWEDSELIIENPTRWPAKFSLLVESRAEAAARPWNSLPPLATYELAPGASLAVKI